ncbi:hypothetical protein [Natrinema longum]|uniref:Uncharacterized protein n=1 Tax=Natrinema longum TaxID=370324 RepID=A0A8A2UD88_9EURY|nr:hypothetical protein [Natrinema longum]MBZ6495449.1 hypothetical protein [Natrinema longum]QSW86580.1 hypothetical protein J0X27_07125 [Natrinema longum]
MKYCLDCDWSLNAVDEPSRGDRSRAAIEHHVETGHTIDSSESTVRPTTPGVAGPVFVRELLPSRD